MRKISAIVAIVAMLGASSAFADTLDVLDAPVMFQDNTVLSGTFDFPANGGEIESINSITVNAEHTWTGDVSIEIVSPDNQSFSLMDGIVGGSADLLGDYVFVASGAANAAGTYANGAGEYDAFSWGTGPFAKSGWTWNIGDDAGGDTGAVNSIVIDFNKTSTIPEPTSALILGIGALAMIRRRR